MSPALPPDPARRRGKLPAAGDPLHHWAGRRITPPPGILAHPGPVKLHRHKRKVMLRVDWMDSSYPGLVGWYATAEGWSSSSWVVAFAPELLPLLIYLNDRFSPCVITVVQDGEQIDPYATPGTPAEGSMPCP